MWRYLEAFAAWRESGLPTELYGLLESLWYAMSPEERVTAQHALKVQLTR